MTTPTNPVDTSSVSSANFQATKILNTIFNTILSLTTSLQAVAAAQANRLTFLTSWQKGYTDVLAQVHTFIGGNASDNGAISGTGGLTSRGDLNKFNANLIATLQAKQSVVSDDAKALQSNVNQSNDAVNSQSNLGTAIIQELSTLTSAIYH